MDVTPYLEPSIAPRAVFSHLPARRDEPRFMVPVGEGTWSAVTWGAFSDQIRQLALFIQGELDAGDRAAIFAPNRVEWLSAALGIQAAGGVMVPVYPSNTPEQMAYIVAHSDSKLLFVDQAPLLERVLEVWDELFAVRRIVVLDDALEVETVARGLRQRGRTVPSSEAIAGKVIRWSQAMEVGAAHGRQDPGAFERVMDRIDLDRPGLMLYTSGTSGPPKGVPLTHRNVAVNAGDWLRCNAPLLEEGDVDLLWLPMSHIFGLGQACLGNTLGWTTYLADPATVVAKLPDVHPHVFMSVPSVWEKLATMAGGHVEEFARITGGRLRFALSGGAGLKREVKEFYQRAGVLLLEGYGLTECSPTLTLNRPDAVRFDSVGQPLPSVKLRLADDGEILAKGASVFAGYHKDPEATTAAFTEDGWFKTGDIGRFTEDGFLQIVDRKKDILVTAGGKNVAPANIELLFQDDPLIDHVVVYGDGQKYLVAGVWLNQAAAGERDKDELRAEVQGRIDELNQKLASFETIKKFMIVEDPLTVENGLLTPTLKVRRKKVYERFGAAFAMLYTA
jgi:long-chain acyl-CoA synthetase